MKLIKSLPIQLVFSILIAFFLGSHLDLATISFFYSLSSVVIEGLIFVLPLIIFAYIFHALISQSKNNFLLILLLFTTVTLSNCFGVFIAYCFGITVLPHLGLEQSTEFLTHVSSQVPLLFSLNLPSLIGAEKALLIGITLGLLICFFKDSHPIKVHAKKSAARLSYAITTFLQKVFIPLLPLYVFGFCLKLSYTQALSALFQQFGMMFLAGFSLVGVYILLLYFIGSQGKFKQTLANIKCMLPAGLTGFSTMSSAATMPVSIDCTEKMTQNRSFTSLIIPTTANIHMLGDNLILMIASLTLLSIFGMPWPDFATFIPFMFAFSLAKLSCVGVPGASVLVVLPVFQEYFGFTPEMLSAMTTLYILQDPFGTSSNVMGNGAFALIIQRILKKVKLLVAT